MKFLISDQTWCTRIKMLLKILYQRLSNIFITINYSQILINPLQIDLILVFGPNRYELSRRDAKLTRVTVLALTSEETIETHSSGKKKNYLWSKQENSGTHSSGSN